MDGSLNRLIWIDLEMTGLDTQRDSIIEIATIVTDNDLVVIAEGPVLAINQPDGVLDDMDDWNTRQHKMSGLVDRVRASQVTARMAERQTLDFLAQHVARGVVAHAFPGRTAVALEVLVAIGAWLRLHQPVGHGRSS